MVSATISKERRGVMRGTGDMLKLRNPGKLLDRGGYKMGVHSIHFRGRAIFEGKQAVKNVTYLPFHILVMGGKIYERGLILSLSFCLSVSPFSVPINQCLLLDE